MRKFLLATGIALAYSASASATDRIRQTCTRDRCVQYNQRGDRLGTTEVDDTGRLVVRDNGYDVTAKISEDDDGSYRVEKSRRRR